MKFALFYETPVPEPFTREKENAVFHNTLEQAVFADEMGWHGFWTVEHHFRPTRSDVVSDRRLAARIDAVTLG